MADVNIYAVFITLCVYASGKLSSIYAVFMALCVYAIVMICYFQIVVLEPFHHQSSMQHGGYYQSTSGMRQRMVIPEKIYIHGELETDKPFITTITSRSTNRKPFSTPNFFHIIADKDCLPTDRICEKCMSDFTRGSCSKCQNSCGCFCDSLCQTLVVQDKVLTKVFEYAPPVYKRHIDGSAQSGRLIPRIVHQTWFEQVTRDK